MAQQGNCTEQLGFAGRPERFFENDTELARYFTHTTINAVLRDGRLVHILDRSIKDGGMTIEHEEL